MPQKRVRQLSFNIEGLHIEQVYEFNLLCLIIDANLNWKVHLNAIGTKVSRIIGLLHKLIYVFPKKVLHSIYNSLIMPHFNYSLLAWGTKSNKIELLQNKAIRVLYSKSPIAHTAPLYFFFFFFPICLFPISGGPNTDVSQHIGEDKYISKTRHGPFSGRTGGAVY